MNPIKQLHSGTSALAYWWLEGQPPVNPSLAQARANICKTCPKNQSATLFEELTGTAAVAVKKALELKHSMKLTLQNESELGMCEACGCKLELKVWTPSTVLFRNGKPDYFNKLDPNCFIRSEANL